MHSSVGCRAGSAPGEGRAPIMAPTIALVAAVGALDSRIRRIHAPKVPGELQPNAAIDMLLDFVTTTEARPFTVQFIDPATKKPLLISLGDVGCQVQSGNGVPLPVQGGCAVAPVDAHSGH